eukprot:1039765-Amphidinium_carterae.2
MSAAKTQKSLKYREMSQEQRIAYHSKQTESIRFKARCKVLNHVITEHPETLNICMEHLRTLGYDIPFEAPKRAKSAELKQEKDEEQDDGQKPAKDEGVEEEPASGSKTRLRPRAGVEDPNPENWVPHCYTSVEAMKAAYLEKILTELFPHRFNAFQYATLKRALKGQPDAPTYHDSLLQLIQFLTGQDTVCSLVGDMRHRPTLMSALSSSVNSRDGWIKSIHFPLDWQSMGIYKLKVSAGACSISSRLHDVGEIDISGALQQSLGVQSLKGLVLQLDKNYNHVLAAVIETTTGKALNDINGIFREQVKKQPEEEEQVAAAVAPCETPPPKRAKTEEP